MEALRKKPLISVIVPVYNVKRYLARCIDSIVGQEYPNLQIIIVDDGSTDGSGEICDRYALRYSNVEAFHKENGGLVSARKAGLVLARGEYIGFVDGDDYIEARMFGDLLEGLVGSQADIIHSGYYKNSGRDIFGAEKAAIFNIVPDNMVSSLKRLVFDFTGEDFISPSIWSKLFRREILAEAYAGVPDNQSYGEDLLCLCNCILAGNIKISVVKEAYYHYVSRGDSICRDRSINSVTREFELYNCLKGLLDKHGYYDALKEEADGFFLRGVAFALQGMTNCLMQRYRLPDMSSLIGKRIALLGAGEVGQSYYLDLCRDQRCKIAAWVAADFMDCRFEFCEVKGLEYLETVEFDLIILGVLSETTAADIKCNLARAGIAPDKIKWFRPQPIF